MKKNIILFLSAIFINMILNLPIKVFALSNVTLNADFSFSDYVEKKEYFEENLETWKRSCSTYSDKFILSYYNNQIWCYDMSAYESLKFYVESGESWTDLVSTYSTPIPIYILDLTGNKIGNGTASNGLTTFYSGNNNRSDVVRSWNDLNGVILYVSDILPCYFELRDNNNFILNGNKIKSGDKIKFFNSEPPSILSINDSCTTPGECESSFITITGDKYLSPLYKYKLEIYFDNVLFSTDEYARFINKELPNIYNDTTLKYKLYQAKLSSNDYELVEEKAYTVDLKYDDPEIIFYREQYTDKMLTLHIYFFINDFNKEYTYQYKKNNEEYISSKDAFLVDLEEDSTIIARVLDKNNKVILTKTYTYKLVDPNAPYADYTVNIYDNMMDFMAYVYNINNNYCDYRVNDGSWSDHNVCDVNSMKGYAIYSNTFTEDTKFSIRIFDSDNNLIYTDTFYIKKDEYIIVPDNYGSNINKFFNKYSNIIKEFQNLIQYTYDNLSEYIKTFLVSMWTIILVVVTVRLIK